MTQKHKFKLSSTSGTSYSDAEALFRDLRNRDPKIQHLWSHQADIIRAYHKIIENSDIAFELPTGSGKTLIGLLIAEWRRIVLKQRAAYLCPTRQLAYQVGKQALEYGIKAVVLVGPQNQYPAAEFSEYASSNAIAITTYSAVFNVNPRIDNPQTIIFDDAHAGENYVARMWSLSISRLDERDLFDQMINLFSDELPDYFLSTLRDDDASPDQRQSVDLLPGPRLLKLKDELVDLLDVVTKETDLSYAWKLLRSSIGVCHIFFSWSEILIRPWIPPTLTHAPFANANQRLYMSATIGAGGDLERIMGVHRINRIPIPAGWDKQSMGRRLFIFPNRSFAPAEYEPWVAETLKETDRILVLAPHLLGLTSFLDVITKYKIKHSILKAQDIEESLDSFTSESKAILALANRYDGLDLPGDACRMLLVYGLPTAVNLQERFLWSKLNLNSILKDRVKTRISQAVGRCTRNSTDYAAVIMLGENLLDFCIKHETRAELHPELKAEMDFGLDNSDVTDLADFSSLLDVFLSRDSQWEVAEADIAKRRNEGTHQTAPYVETLRNVVYLEVETQYDLWTENFEGALDKATAIIDKLPGDQLAGYRAFWNYIAGCTAYHLGKITNKPAFMKTASVRFHSASQAIRTVSWFARLSHELDAPVSAEIESDYLTALATESINEYLTVLGTVGEKFAKTVSTYLALIKDNNAERFDRGLTELGKMLGFQAEKPEGSGTPDSLWKLGDEFILLFECKSDETPADGISISTCRQAQGHRDWAKSRPFFNEKAKTFIIVVTPREFVSKDALPHIKGLHYQHVDELRTLFQETEKCLHKIRSKCPNLDPEQRLKIICDAIKRDNLTPGEIVKRLTMKSLSDLPSR